MCLTCRIAKQYDAAEHHYDGEHADGDGPLDAGIRPLICHFLARAFLFGLARVLVASSTDSS